MFDCTLLLLNSKSKVQFSINVFKKQKQTHVDSEIQIFHNENIQSEFLGQVLLLEPESEKLQHHHQCPEMIRLWISSDLLVMGRWMATHLFLKQLLQLQVSTDITNTVYVHLLNVLKFLSLPLKYKGGE